ncbi:cadherin domain-containing protein [Flammeovirgaceae bacterium SG7u.111]|nr:cadherin domain-containing protein [Flammeovirgaceae bacterium SG7u.132]WPO35730.1 cadherin domain-containing protein [Flammeovirgaceae bacterium SG7u.111]
MKLLKFVSYIGALSLLFVFQSCKDDEEPTPQNVAPVMVAQSFSISEGASPDDVLGTIVATDPEGETLTFSITTNDNNLFAISTSGALSLATGKSLDFETATNHTITVAVSDGDLETEVDITITVVDVNENTAPEINAQTFSIRENIDVRSAIATIVATDKDSDALTYSISQNISQNNKDLFEFEDESVPEISLTSGQSLDFESITSYSIEITVSDGKLTAVVDITINVTDVNDAPVVAAQTFTVAEGVTDNTVIGTVAATDEDGDVLSYSLALGIGSDNIFEINASGQISLAEGKKLDYETATSHILTVEVSDGEASKTAKVTINVTDLDDIAIPDANFITALLNNSSINTNGNSVIETAEASSFTGTISAANSNIESVEGIEFFTNATRISLYGNSLTSIDLSSNTKVTQLLLESNKLKTIDVSMLSELTDFKAHSNELTTVNLANGNNANMTRMQLQGNPGLTCIKVDQLPVPTSGWSKDASASYSIIDCE